jgi:hypothetical protein
VQPARIPVDVGHDGRPVGRVVHLERSGGGSVWAVAEIDDDVELLGRSFSAHVTRADGDSRWVIDSLALTDDPAMVGVGVVRIVGPAPDEAALLRLRARGHDHLAGMLQRAAARREGEPLVIDGGQPAPALMLRGGAAWVGDGLIGLPARPGLPPPPVWMR